MRNRLCNSGELERLAEIDKAITAKRDAAYHLKYKASEELRKAATRGRHFKYLAAAAVRTEHRYERSRR
ncbi:MAG: hypothetical protein R3C56_17795 [Pirellulaceae bacterium]